MFNPSRKAGIVYFMRKLTILIVLSSITFAWCFFSFKKEDDLLKQDFTIYFQKSIGSFLKTYDTLYKYVNEEKILEKDKCILLFSRVRYEYKKNELFLEYFAPSTAGMLNMALIPDVDEYDPNQYTQEPEGLQKIEELIFAEDTINQYVLLQELKRTRGAILRAQQITQTLEPQEYQIFEASKQEIVRLWTFNFTGIDAAYSKNTFNESKYVLYALNDIINLLEKNAVTNRIKKQSRNAKKIITEALLEINNNPDFDTFNRLEFTKKYLFSLYGILVEIEKGTEYGINPLPTPIKPQAKNILNNDAWNTFYFTSDKINHSNNKQIELGRMLFFDPVLSGNNKRACASCHRPEYGFSEPVAKSIMFDQNGELSRNAPSLLNVVFQKAFFYDARITYLEDQVVEVNQNVNEMHGNFNHISDKLKGSEEYKKLFREAFVGSSDTIINKNGIIRAISEYERSLVSLNTKFDRYMRGEKVTMNTSEINGYNLFMGKAQCGTCHFAPFFNGTVPPNFEDTEWEIIGVPKTKENKMLDEDKGRYNVAKMEIHQYAFKTPTVRNIAYTAPYMHNGVYEKLEDVISFYNNGGGIGHGYEVPNQTLPSDSLKLSKEEMNDLISFMNCLSDTIDLTKKPDKLPVIKVAGSDLLRQIGGEY